MGTSHQNEKDQVLLPTSVKLFRKFSFMLENSFPNIKHSYRNSSWLAGRAISAAKNDNLKDSKNFIALNVSCTAKLFKFRGYKTQCTALSFQTTQVYSWNCISFRLKVVFESKLNFQDTLKASTTERLRKRPMLFSAVYNYQSSSLKNTS